MNNFQKSQQVWKNLKRRIKSMKNLREVMNPAWTNNVVIRNQIVIMDAIMEIRKEILGLKVGE